MTRGGDPNFISFDGTKVAFTTVATLNFRKATGAISESGEHFDLTATGVRQVKFVIGFSWVEL